MKSEVQHLRLPIREATTCACTVGSRSLWLLVLIDLFDLCRLEESHLTAAVLQSLRSCHEPRALPPVLADAAAAAVLAEAAPPAMRTGQPPRGSHMVESGVSTPTDARRSNDGLLNETQTFTSRLGARRA